MVKLKSEQRSVWRSISEIAGTHRPAGACGDRTTRYYPGNIDARILTG